jgi:hypothetical protein
MAMVKATNARMTAAHRDPLANAQPRRFITVVRGDGESAGHSFQVGRDLFVVIQFSLTKSR